MAIPPEQAVNQSIEKQEYIMPYRYVVAVILMLLILVAAVITPDLLPYMAPKLGLNVPMTSTGTQLVPNTQIANPGTSLFETYARLVTLFLALVSVLGVFFGYFVRKSIRETEEDIDTRFDRNLKLWESERDSLLKKYTEEAEKLTDKLKIIDDLEKRFREALDAWENANSRYTLPFATPAPSVVEASAQQVDEQLSKPESSSQ